MVKKDETNTLRKVLERVGIPDSYYSIGEYKEGAVCIEENDEGYVVYGAERAERNEKKEHEEYVKTALDVISRIAMTKEDGEYLKNEFYLERTKEILEKTLELNDIPHIYYSLEGYSEEAVCLEKTELGYLVYNGEKGNKYAKKEHPNIGDAIVDLISRVSESDAQNKIIQFQYFLRMMDELKKTEIMKGILE